MHRKLKMTQVESPYLAERELMDYNWFPRYPEERWKLQDDIVSSIFAVTSLGISHFTKTVIYTSGTYGSGKSHALRTSLRDKFRTTELPLIDPDAIRRKLPEYSGTAVEQTQRESTFIALLAERACLRRGISYIVDGSLVNVDWYRPWFRRVIEAGYTVILLNFSCSLDTANQRCIKRAAETGRYISPTKLARVYERIPDAWNALKHLGHLWFEYNTDTEPLKLVDYGINLPWFQHPV
jgi:predicted ABC-type ATPase